MNESDHDIGHLHPGVVDVVLDIDAVIGRAQQPHKRIAQDGVAQVSNVSSLVGIDAGVLDQDFAGDVGRTFARVVGDRGRRLTGTRDLAATSRFNRALM